METLTENMKKTNKIKEHRNFNLFWHTQSALLIRREQCLIIINLEWKKKEKKEETLTEKWGGKAHTNKQKLNWDISMITDVFLDQKRVDVFEHTVKTAPWETPR